MAVRRRVPVRTSLRTFAVPPGDVTAAEWTGLNNQLTAFQVRTDPGVAGDAGEILSVGPAGIIWHRLPYVDVTHPRFVGGAVGDGSTDSTTQVQAAIAKVEDIITGTQTGGVVLFPDGHYRVTNLTVSAQGVTFRGTGRYSSWLSTTTGDLVTLTSASKFRAESMRFISYPGGGHIFKIANSLSYSYFTDLWCSQMNDDKSILWGDDTVTGGTLNYIDNLWLHCDTVHTETATVPSFHLRGKAVNRNRWMSMRHTYTGNYAFLIETTAASSYANDNVISDINFEVCTGGIVKALGAQKLRLVDLAVYDLLNSTTRDLIYLGSSTVTPTLNTRNVKVAGLNRNGFTLGAGLFDINVLGSAATPDVTLDQSGGSTALLVDANTKRIDQRGGNVILTDGSFASWQGIGSNKFHDPVTFDRYVVYANYTTAARNALTGVPSGGTVYDTTLKMLVTYDGAAWRDQAGTAV